MDRSSLPDILVSDVHEGLETSRADLVNKLIDEGNFNRIVVVGDLLNGNLSGFTDAMCGLLSRLRELNKEGRAFIVWGNHDIALLKVMELLTGIAVAESYEWESHGYKCLAIHGHQFDAVCSKSSVIASVLTWMLTTALAHRWLHYPAERFCDWLHVEWEKLTPKVRDGVSDLASARHATVAFAGHTHVHEGPAPARRGYVIYTNLGCCLGTSSTYGTVEADGPHLRPLK